MRRTLTSDLSLCVCVYVCVPVPQSASLGTGWRRVIVTTDDGAMFVGYEHENGHRIADQESTRPSRPPVSATNAPTESDAFDAQDLVPPPADSDTVAEKASRFLASEMVRFGCALTTEKGVFHVLAQSVAYRYEFKPFLGEVKCYESRANETSEATRSGRFYWQIHCDHSDEAILLGAQLTLQDTVHGSPGFVEGDCRFMHKLLRHMRNPIRPNAEFGAPSASDGDGSDSSSFRTQASSVASMPPSSVVLVARHMESYERLMTEEERALKHDSSQNAKARVYLYKKANAIRARAVRAGGERGIQLSALDLASVHRGGDAYDFFVDVRREHVQGVHRQPQTRLTSDLKLTVLFGSEHVDATGQRLRAFYQRFFYRDSSESFWEDKLGAKAVSFVILADDGRVVAAQTLYVASTVLGDPVLYVALIASESQTRS